MEYSALKNLLKKIRLFKTLKVFIIKRKIMINWINGFDAGNKKEKYYLECRLGTFTVLELKWYGGKFRFMVLNLGFELYT